MAGWQLNSTFSHDFKAGASMSFGNIVATLAKSVGDLPKKAHPLGEGGYDTY